MAGRPARPGRDRARAQPGLEARAVRPAGHRGRASPRATRAGWRGTASTAPGSAPCGPASRRTQPGVGRPGVPRPKWQRVMDLLAAQGHLDAARRPPGPVARDVRRRGRAGLGDDPPAAVRPAAAGHGAVPASATGRRRSRPSSTTSGPTSDDLLDGWVAAWEVAAQRWRTQPYLMGYDLINEPWMGLEWADLPGRPAASRRTATSCSRRMDQAPAAPSARSTADNIVWWEPQQFAGGQKIETFFEPMPRGERQLGFSWHNYCPDVFLESQGVPGGDVENCWEFSRDRNRHALDQAAPDARGAADERVGRHRQRARDRDRRRRRRRAPHGLDRTGPTSSGTTRPRPTTPRACSATTPTSRRVKRDKLRRLVRTYAQATAGTPAARCGSTPTTGAFLLPLPARTAAIAAPTEIFVSPLHYPRRLRRAGHAAAGCVDRERAHACTSRPTGEIAGDGANR